MKSKFRKISKNFVIKNLKKIESGFD